MPFALVKIQLEPCASLDCGEVDGEDYYTVPEHYEDVPVDVELDMHVDFDDIEDLQHLEEEVTRLGGKDRDVMVEQALPSRSRARTAHQLQLSKNLLSQLEDNMRLKVSQTPRPIDPNNILHLLDSILQPLHLLAFWNRRQAVPGQAAPIFEDDNMDAMGESELEHFVECCTKPGALWLSRGRGSHRCKKVAGRTDETLDGKHRGT